MEWIDIDKILPNTESDEGWYVVLLDNFLIPQIVYLDSFAWNNAKCGDFTRDKVKNYLKLPTNTEKYKAYCGYVWNGNKDVLKLCVIKATSE